jgi:plastocyanin
MVSAGAGDLSRRRVLSGVLAGVVGAALAACGTQSGPAARRTRSAVAAATVTVAPDGTQEITLTVADDYVFLPDHFSVTRGRVRLTLTSIAKQLTHNIRFTPDKSPVHIREEIPILPPGDSKTIEFSVAQPGDYQYECSFHVQLGQIGTMTVTPS